MKKTKRNNKIGVKYTKSKKIKKNNSRKIKKNNSRKIKRGGEYINAGSFGAIYANPRLLCEYETLNRPGIYDEVSKIFEFNDDATDEINNIIELESGLGNDLEEFKKYAIIPKKMCDINLESLKKPPYDNDKYGKYNNIKKWMSKKYKGIYGENIYNDDIFTPLRTPLHYNNNKYYGKLIISDKGDSDLLNFFNEINSDDFFKYCLREIISIGKGIKILQDNGFIHNDIKASNCIKHNNTFKLIDLAQSKNIKNTIENINCNSYVYWPHTVVYTHFFKDKNVKQENIIMTKELVSELFNKYLKFNINQYKKHMPILFNIFAISNEYGFTQEEIDRVHEIRDNLYFQKTFNITNPYVYFNDNDINKNIIKTLNDPNFSVNQNYNDFLEKFNTIFQNFENIDTLKMDLFKRIDIYGFGMIILECIGMYLDYKNKQTNNDIIISEDIREIILKLYEIIYKCCYQGERVANFDEIIKEYISIVPYYYIEKLEKTLSEQRILDEFKQYAIILSKNVEINNYKTMQNVRSNIKESNFDGLKNILYKLISIIKGIRILHNNRFYIKLIDYIEDNNDDTFKLIVSDDNISFEEVDYDIFSYRLLEQDEFLKKIFNLNTKKGFTPEEVSEIYEMASGIFNSFSENGDTRFNIRRRLDIYNFGIMILEDIHDYLNSENYNKDENNDENIHKAIIQLFLFSYKCCYQEKHVTDIDEIISEYENICGKLLNNDYVFSELKLPSPPLPPSSSPSMPRFIKKI